MAETTPYIGLARRYRPQLFSDLVGQEQIGQSLSQQILQDRVAQGYIFAGPRGIGKTSAARILAKSLNCVEGPTPTPCGVCEQCRSITSGNSLDVHEIDGASNRKIDDIRDLQERISQSTFGARRKVYIIDEVHMLTREAFNALLKTLEEPPEFVIFVLATTDPEHIPETIKSRCQFFQFNRIGIDDLIKRLDFVADDANIRIEPGERDAIFETIALAVDGGMRDAMMTLDQLASLCEDGISLDATTRFLGLVEHDLLLRTVELLQARDTRALLEMVNDLIDRGRDLDRYIRNLLGFLRDLMVLKCGGDPGLVKLGGSKLERARALLETEDENGRKAEVLSYPALLNYLQVFMNLEAEIKEAVQVRVHLEFAFVKLTAVEPVVDIGNLLRNFDRLSASGGGGNASQPAPPTTPTPATSPPKPASPPASKAASPAPAAKDKPASPEPPSRPQPKPSSAPPATPPAPETPDLFGGRSALTDEDARMLLEAIRGNVGELSHGNRLALGDVQDASFSGDKLILECAPKRKLSVGSMEKAERRRELEALVARLAGRPLSVEARLAREDKSGGAKRTTSTSRAPQRPTPPAPVEIEPEPQPEPPLSRDDASEAEQLEALYLREDPTARSRHAVQQEGPFRDKVRMVQEFFGGKLLDPSGNEIPL